jgi:hypothetical protein
MGIVLTRFAMTSVNAGNGGVNPMISPGFRPPALLLAVDYGKG